MRKIILLVFFFTVGIYTAPQTESDTALIAAVRKGDTAVVESLLKEGADVNARGLRGETALIALMDAAERGIKVEIFQLLIAAKADVNAKVKWRGTALTRAVERGTDPSVVEWLLQAGANVGETDLMEAINRRGKPETVKLLIAAKANVNAKEGSGTTALMKAADKGIHVEIFKLLITAKAAINTRDQYGRTALIHAARNGADPEVVRLLIAAKANLNVAEKHLEQGGHQAQAYGRTALMWAADERNLEIARLLIEAGANVDLKSGNGSTVLHGTAYVGCTEIAALLIAAKAKINVKNDVGETPLMLAAEKGYDETVKLLIAANADTNTKNRDGQTALHQAVTFFGKSLRGGNEDVNAGARSVELLIAAHADVNAKDKEGKTPLMVSIVAANLTTELLRKSMTEAGKSHYATEYEGRIKRYIEYAKRLIEAKANINAKDKKGVSVLAYATKGGNQEIIDILKAAGATE